MPLWTAPAALLLGVIAGTFGEFLVAAIGSAFGSPIANPTTAVSVAESIVFDLGFVGTAIYLLLLYRGTSVRDLGFRRIRIKTAVAVVVLAAAGFYLASTIYADVFHLTGTDRLPQQLSASKTNVPAGIETALFVCVLAPIFEEFFFRGFLFGVLRQIPARLGKVNLGPWIAALIVAIVFGAAHLGSASSTQFLVPLGIFGFVLCIVRWRTGSLYPCIALHALNNAVALGANEFGWGPGPIIALTAGSLAIALALTLPLSRRGPAN
jgi:membrane protease YdiL (CAAX protease family)